MIKPNKEELRKIHYENTLEYIRTNENVKQIKVMYDNFNRLKPEVLTSEQQTMLDAYKIRLGLV
jgi:hypothetical protein